MDKPGDMLLGRQVGVVDHYSPELLYPIARGEARAALGIGAVPPFHGCDLWHAYELSWLDSGGVPQARVGRFQVPADSPNMVESKSLKLYLNSLNNSRFASDDEVRAVLERDLRAVTGAESAIELLPVNTPAFAGTDPEGTCLDALAIGPADGEAPGAHLLQSDDRQVVESLFSHLLRSLCPVTGQPDWATLWIRYRGRALDHASLLRYIVAFRRHQEFHEQCVERIFVELTSVLAPEHLEVQAFYTRRGGLDINPYRSTSMDGKPRPRMNRQ